MITYLDTDRQTNADLNISDAMGSERPLSSLFLKTETKPGRNLMMDWLLHPLADREQILKRQEAVAWTAQPELPLDEEELDFIEYYLKYREQIRRANVVLSCVTVLDRLLRPDSARYIIRRGVRLVILMLCRLQKWEEEFPTDTPLFWKEILDEIHDILQYGELSTVLPRKTDSKLRLSSYQIDKYDYLFRTTCLSSLQKLLAFIYTLDVCRTSHRVALEKHWYCTPELTQDNAFLIRGFAHPFVKDAQKNNWSMSRGNICLFTGSNMAGKSTTLKALAISVWLAHCGLPVPAEAMSCPLYGGIYTSINLPDSLRDGRSHFMAELFRIKEVLAKAGEGRQCLVVLDEMFRGTNATDAFEASVAVNEILKRYPNCHFLVSTHILEYAKAFRDDPSCCFYYMAAEIKDNELHCPHRLHEGISEARVGYWLVKKLLLSPVTY